MSTLADLARSAHSCVVCPLSEGRTNVVFGVGNPSADLMFVGEAPGRDEDLQGEPFVGRSGKLLDRLIAEELGIDRSSCYIANTLKCRPPDNRDPLPSETATCRHFLDEQIELVDPAVIVTLGNFAARALLGTTEGVTRLRGHTYPFGDRVLVPTFHPAAALRSGGVVLVEMRADLVRAEAGARPSMIQLSTASAEETRAFGALLAEALLPGDVVLLCGDLGAGKTTLVQGIGAGLGIDEPMTSPTFTLVHTYGSEPVVADVDAWRLSNLREVLDLGLDELLDDGAIALVEWGDAVAEAIGPDALVVRLDRPAGGADDDRVITVVSTGGPAPARFAQLADRLATRSGLPR